MKIKTEQKEKELPSKFIGRFSNDGGLNFSDFTKRKLKFFIRENPGMIFELNPRMPESSSQRGWFEGALLPLICFYQVGMDHRDSKDVVTVREWVKIEFLGDIVTIHGKSHRIAKSTRNQLNLGFLERVVAWLEENYAPPHEALDPKTFKHWRDAIFPYGGPDNFLEYLVEIKILKHNKQ